MEPTQRVAMLSHPDGHPRPLTPREEARIRWMLRNDPPIHTRPVKLAAVPQHIPTPRQPWELRNAA